MFNKDLRSIDTTIFLNKLAALLERLNIQYQDGTFQTQEDVIEEFRYVISTFYNNPVTPFLQLRKAQRGTSPSYADYNSSFGELGKDLNIIYKELATLEQIILKNFNFILSEKDKINKLIKRVSSKVGDYVLYSEDPIGDTIYFKDSFNDVSRIDFGSSLLSEKQCEINVSEGIITLPLIISGTPMSRAMKVKINASSGPNGSIGNYQEIGAAPHDDIRDILDNNPDTWFEYERVQRTKAEDTSALRLDLTFYFDIPQIINFIRVNPNNFGTQTPITIEQIDTSYDGNIWVSIKDDIPISGFLQEDEENIFSLAPSTSKYAGQGLYTFTPRKVKYIHLTLKQNTPYEIDTSAGKRWRYAIGIRDVEARAQPYEAAGDIISMSYSSPVEIKKISLLASENPTEISELADIKHQISVDDGATWHDIQPQNRSGTDIPEILNFNTGDTNAINTSSKIFSLRHRMLLSRDTDMFKEGSSTLSSIVEGASDILALPLHSPIVLGITRAPVANTLRIMNPLWGARALDGLKIVDNVDGYQEVRRPVIRSVGRSTGHPNQEFKEVLSKEIGGGLVDIWSTDNEVIVWIDNDSTWTRVGSFTADNSKEYKITNDGSIIFGNRDTVASTGAGRIPSAGSLIGFTLKEERLLLSASSPYICDLIFSTDGDKKNTKIYRIDASTQIPNSDNPEAFSIRPGANIIRLPHRLLVEGDPTPESTLTFSGTGATTTFATYVAFQDGISEFSGGGGEYSVDWEEGIVYSEDGVPADADGWTIGYWYIPRTELLESDWDFIIDADRKYNRIVINDTGYAEIEVDGIALTANVRMVQLTDSNGDLVKCIVPGSIDFSSSTPFTSGSFPYEVPFIDGETEFKHTDTEIDTSGYFSVDYQHGILYVASGDSTAASPGNVSFKYTNFVACYNISKFMNNSAYSVDSDNKKIVIDEHEIIKLWGDRDYAVANKQIIKVIYDYVQATRESIEELEPYFTPIVRDYAIKILSTS